jgi:hypothetical protein
LRPALPPRFSRKTVAAIQGIVLVVAGAGVVPRPWMISAVALALAMLTWSFASDIRWLWQRRSALDLGLPTPARHPARRGQEAKI